MIGELESRQILSLAGDGASPAEIAKGLGVEESLVRLVLSSHEVGNTADRDINDEQLEALRRHAYNLAIGSSEESIQAKMTMFLLERDKPSGGRNGNSITAINQALILANGAFEKLTKEFQNT